MCVWKYQNYIHISLKYDRKKYIALISWPENNYTRTLHRTEWYESEYHLHFTYYFFHWIYFVNPMHCRWVYSPLPHASVCTHTYYSGFIFSFKNLHKLCHSIWTPISTSHMWWFLRVFFFNIQTFALKR